MKTIESRLSKLERRLGIAGTASVYLVVLNDRELAHTDDADTYINILDEGGFLHTAGFGTVDFSRIPLGLNGKEAERFVRENGAKICGLHDAQNPSGRKVEVDQERSAQSVVIELEDRSVYGGQESI
jgi:hypothetical protein